MPTYGYKCPKCGHEYEKFQKMSDATRAKCPNCGTRGERMISGGAGVVFKGSGFYETDYKRASASSRSAEEKKNETPKTETPKTETTKPETKPSEKPKK